ncbi:MAG: AAA family ATPase [Elusimicrobiota bacterium]
METNMNRRPRRSPFTLLCARLTAVVFAANLAAPAAWAQSIVRVAPVATAPIGAAGAGASVSAAPMAPSSLAPMSALAPLSAPSAAAAVAPASALQAAALPAAVAASVPALAKSPAASPAAAPVTAAGALKSAAVGAAASTGKDVSASEGSARSARTFDAAAARPADSPDAVPAGIWSAAPALGLSRSSHGAAADGPARGSSPNGADHRAVANSLDAKLRRSTVRGGDLIKKAALAEQGASVGVNAENLDAVLGLLAADGRLMRLSGGAFVYSDLTDRFDSTSGDQNVDRAGVLAQDAIKAMNASRKLPDHARAVATLEESLEILKEHGETSAAAEVRILMNNASFELLRDILREAAVMLREKEKTDSSRTADREKAESLGRELQGMHFGAGLEAPAFDAKTQIWLENLVGSLNASKRNKQEGDGRMIGRGLGVLYSLIAPNGENTGKAPAERPMLALPAPTPNSQPTAPAKPAYKALDASEYKTLYEFGTDVTLKAASGKMRPMIGRKAEIRQMVKTLLRVEKNNPLVIGEKGVGKTAIINGLAQMIISGDIPELAGKTIIKIDLNKVVAGTKYRGEFEERMQKIIDEAKKSNGRVILFIDEMHMIVGAGGASGSPDASQILKESLADGSLSLIGATTMDEFRRIEKDGALMRRFNPVKLLPPTKDEAEAILEGVKGVYEQKHGVTIALETVKAAVSLAYRYVTDRHLPDSALDLMDDASAEVELKASEAKAKGEENPTKAVTAEDIAREISLRTGIPAGKLNEDKKSQLKNLPSEMKSQVIGQDEAVEKVAEAVQAGETGFRDPKQPIASFVFLGPTGVGKTELARILAKIKFGSEKNMLRLDMSEYQEKSSVSRLISAPPGYVGHEEGGQLTESIRRNPYQVILLDEIEKAHPEVFDVLLQVLEDGRLTDGQGRTVDFSNTIIIMTSNIGGSVSGDESEKAADGWRDGGDGFEYKQDGMGFNAKTLKRAKAGAAMATGRAAHYLDAFKKKYRPEFVNRVGEDRVIVFNEITEKSKLGAILDLRLKALENQLKEKGLKVALTDGAREAVLAKALQQSQYGARPIKQIVDREINRALKDAELEGRITDGDAVTVDWSAAEGRYVAGKSK